MKQCYKELNDLLVQLYSWKRGGYLNRHLEELSSLEESYRLCQRQYGLKDGNSGSDPRSAYYRALYTKLLFGLDREEMWSWISHKSLF